MKENGEQRNGRMDTISVLTSKLTKTSSPCCFYQPYSHQPLPYVPIGSFSQDFVSCLNLLLFMTLQGIFWDIENIRLPRYKSAVRVIEAIRRKFLVNYREAEFLVVCDVRKERKELVIDLNNAQVIVLSGGLKRISLSRKR